MERKIYRARWHDYRGRCVYMVTLSKAPGVEDFGVLGGDVRVARGELGAPFVNPGRIGEAIKAVIWSFREIEPSSRVLQYALMPDHLHLLIFIESRTEATLGMIVARFKVAVNKRVGMTHVFDKGFNDQILKPGRSLDVLFNYLRDNPRRLAERRANPDFFRRLDQFAIGDRVCRAYGNMQLLQNPFKEQVVIHRADSPQQRERNRQQWLYTASNGGVLVSPFISATEKAIRDEADAIGGRFIMLTTEIFGERYKPSGHLFDLCAEGRLLIVSTGDGEASRTISRAQCLDLNSLAAAICSNAR